MDKKVNSEKISIKKGCHNKYYLRYFECKIILGFQMLSSILLNTLHCLSALHCKEML